VIARCSFIPESIWLRDITESGLRRVTLRRNFTEETNISEQGEETYYAFEEVDVFVSERENMEEFITQNFGNLFYLGLSQTEQAEIEKQNQSETENLIRQGTLANELKILGQQITSIMLEV
jgi:hypothetical protein